MASKGLLSLISTSITEMELKKLHGTSTQERPKGRQNLRIELMRVKNLSSPDLRFSTVACMTYCRFHVKMGIRKQLKPRRPYYMVLMDNTSKTFICNHTRMKRTSSRGCIPHILIVSLEECVDSCRLHRQPPKILWYMSGKPLDASLSVS